MNIKRLLGETIIYGIGAILPRVITFLLNPLYINYIDKEAFAIFTSLYAWIAFINIVLTFGFETSYFRFSGEDKTGNKEKNVFPTVSNLNGLQFLAEYGVNAEISNSLKRFPSRSRIRML